MITELLSLHDEIMRIAPPGWSDISVQASGGRLEVSTHRLRPGDAREPLGLQPSLALGKIAKWMHERGDVVARCKRDHRYEARWALFDGPRVIAEHTLGREELAGLLVSDDLLDLIEREVPVFQARQAAFQAHVGPIRSSAYFMDRGIAEFRLVDGRELRVRADLLGTWVVRGASTEWLWAWAHPQMTERQTRRLRAVCERDEPFVRALREPHGERDIGLLEMIVMLAASRLGAQAVWSQDRRLEGDSAGHVVTFLALYP
jgi:hypothetical protein